MTGDTVGGVWTFTLDLAEALGAYDIEVVLATFGGMPSAAQSAEAARIANLRLMPTEFRLEWMSDPWRDVEESGRWLMRLAEEYNPDAIHLNSFGHGALNFGKPVVLTAHSCVLSWWEAVKGGRAPREWDRYAAAVKASVQNADVVTAPSRAMAHAVRKHYGVNDCVTIPNGRKGSRFFLGQKEPFVFTAGRLRDEAKNVAALNAVAPLLPWKVVSAGDGAALGRLSSDEMADWYARASLYALPARYEPFGLSALEAALSGCALVLGDIDSLREVWGDAAVYVDPDDTHALQTALEGLIADETLRTDLARRSYAHALTYRAETMAARYRETYRMVTCAS
jgi:glycosyltransferase involved in cell wall biosynthesis